MDREGGGGQVITRQGREGLTRVCVCVCGGGGRGEGCVGRETRRERVFERVFVIH